MPSGVRTCAATLHHLIITLHVGSNKDDLRPEALPRVSKKLHGIWSSSSFLRVPEDHPLGLDVVVD